MRKGRTKEGKRKAIRPNQNVDGLRFHYQFHFFLDSVERNALLQCALSANSRLLRFFLELANDATSWSSAAAWRRSSLSECISTTTPVNRRRGGSGKEERIRRSRGQARARRSEKGKRDCIKLSMDKL